MANKFSINITPYIDILLVLLIIFMVIQPQSRFELSSRAARTEEESQPARPRSALILDVDSELSLELNRKPVSMPGLGRALFEALSRRSDRNLFIRGARELPFGDIVRLVDVAKGAGAADIGLLTSEDR